MEIHTMSVLAKVIAGLVWLVASGIVLIEKGRVRRGNQQMKPEKNLLINEDGQEFTNPSISWVTLR